MVLLPHFYDTHLAPGFAKFGGATLEDLSSIHPEQSHWLSNYALNQLTHSVTSKYRELAFNHLRRAQGALTAYHTLRELLRNYGSSGKRVTSYFAALDQAEICISFAAQAFELLNRMQKLLRDTPIYQHASKQDLDRLHDFYVACKHVANMVDGSQFEAPDTVVFWFTDKGLQSRRRGLLSFDAFANVLRELVHDASILSNYIPGAEENGA